MASRILLYVLLKLAVIRAYKAMSRVWSKCHHVPYLFPNDPSKTMANEYERSVLRILTSQNSVSRYLHEGVFCTLRLCRSQFSRSSACCLIPAREVLKAMLELYPKSSTRARGKCEGRKSLSHSLSLVVHVASAESPLFVGFKP